MNTLRRLWAFIRDFSVMDDIWLEPDRDQFRMGNLTHLRHS